MHSKLLTAETQINNEVGFKYHSVYLNIENSTLHSHDYYEIFLVVSNNLNHYINGVTQNLSNGTLTFIRKSDEHYFFGENINAISFINFAFNEEIANDLFKYLGSSFCSKQLLAAKMPPSIHLTEHNIDWMWRQLENLNAIDINNKQQKIYLSRILLFNIFTKFFSGYTDTYITDNAANIPEWMVELNYNMHKFENFSQHSDRMVELSGRCRAYLGRMVKMYYNKTISEYINEIRLNYLANTLITTDIPISNICYECGFENISWAYTLFKKKFGTSPLAFRNKNKI